MNIRIRQVKEIIMTNFSNSQETSVERSHGQSALRYWLMTTLTSLLVFPLMFGGFTPAGRAAEPPIQGTVPTISGKIQFGETVTALPGDWQPEPVGLSYQWRKNGEDIPGATAQSFEIPIDTVGLNLTVVVTGTKDGHASASLSSAPSLVLPRPFDAMGGGVVAGDRQIGELLTATVAETDWRPAPTSFEIIWYRFIGGSGTPVSKGASYRITEADAGARIYTEVMARREGYLGRTGIGNTTIPDRFDAAPTPTLTAANGGQARVGVELIGVPGIWEPTPQLSYQWLRDGEVLPGVTSTTYTPSTADVCSELFLKVTGTRDGYQRTEKTSSAQLIFPADGSSCNKAMTPATPTVTGTAAVDQQLEVQHGTWTPRTATLSYQWYRGSMPIEGATEKRYTAGPDDYLKQLSVRVSGAKPGWIPTTVSSTPVTIWGGELTAPEYRLNGTPVIGKRVVVVQSNGSWGPGQVNVNYQWFYDGVPVPDSDRRDHTVRSEGLGKVISVKVTGSKLSYNWKTLTMTGGAIQVPAQPLELFTATPQPVATGTATLGSKLSASTPATSGWVPQPEQFTYQWLRAGQPIPNATGSEYTLVAADAGKRVSVRVRGIRVDYQEASRVSAERLVAPLKPVLRKLTATPKPRISGTVRVGKKLSVRAGSWKPARVSLSYRWLRNGKAIKGATKSKYRLTSKDRGKRISVRVTGKKSGYVTVVKTSSSKRVARR